MSQRSTIFHKSIQHSFSWLWISTILSTIPQNTLIYFSENQECRICGNCGRPRGCICFFEKKIVFSWFSVLLWKWFLLLSDYFFLFTWVCLDAPLAVERNVAHKKIPMTLWLVCSSLSLFLRRKVNAAPSHARPGCVAARNLHTCG